MTELSTKKKNIDLGNDPVAPLLVRLAVPTIISHVVNLLYNVVDRIYIGHMVPSETVGKLALTGLGVCSPLIVLVSAFVALLAQGAAPRASIAEGRGDIKESERIMGNSLTLLVIASVILTLITEVFTTDLLTLFGASENTIGYASDYMRIYAIGNVFSLVTMGMNAMIMAQGFTDISMITTLIGSILNVLLDPIFIFTFNMGVKGAALATILSQAVSFVWVLAFITGDKTRWKLRKENLLLNPSVFLPGLALGLSPFIMQSTESLLTVCFNTSLLKYGGDTAVAAMTILSSAMQVMFLPVNGLSHGAQPIISFNFGAGKIQRVLEAFKSFLVMALAYTVTVWAFMELFPATFIRIFNNDQSLVLYTARALRIYMGSMGLFGIQVACQQTFVAIGNAKTSLFLAVLRKLILLIPLIFLLPMFFSPQDIAVFSAEPVSDFIAVSTTAVLFRRQWKKLKESC